MRAKAERYQQFYPPKLGHSQLRLSALPALQNGHTADAVRECTIKMLAIDRILMRIDFINPVLSQLTLYDSLPHRF